MKKALLMILLLAPAAAHDLGVSLDPAADLGLFPTFNEVSAAMDSASMSPIVSLYTVGASESGEDIRVAEIIVGDAPTSERAVTFIMTQQHGNEPAGTPAAIDLLGRIVDGEFAESLENQVLLLLPMANPDGATANTRANDKGVDINRDHIALETEEGRAIHAVLNQWNVHVAVDHHEYSGTGVGYPSPVRFYDFDLTTMFPNHGNVRAPTRTMTESLIYEGVWPHMESRGYSAGNYGVQTVAGVPVQQVAGGPDPGILRNSFGLNNVAGFLAESFVGVDQNPLHDAARREAIHLETMSATLNYVHDNADKFIQAKAESERLNLEDPAEFYVEGSPSTSLPKAFQGINIDPLMAFHGLPLGSIIGDTTTYNMANERHGLLAAMMAPGSSRAVGEFATSAPVLEPENESNSEETPFAGLALVILGLIVLTYRKN